MLGLWRHYAQTWRTAGLASQHNAYTPEFSWNLRIPCKTFPKFVLTSRLNF